MTDSPDQPPPKPPVGATQQLAALVEDVPEDDVDDGAAPPEEGEGDEGDAGDYGPPDSQVPLVSRPPPLLPKEKKQVRNRTVLVGGVVFVVCVVLAVVGVIAFGGHGPAQQPRVATRPVVLPIQAAATPAPHPHTHITLDEIVFTSDGGASHP